MCNKKRVRASYMKNYVEYGRYQYLGLLIKRSSCSISDGHRNLQLVECKSGSYSADSQAGSCEFGDVAVNLNGYKQIRP